MPWLLAAALLHSAIVVEKRESLKSWTILLAILAFGFSLIGTFIVRSGLLTSVHAFANDPERGVWILLIMAFFMGGALLLFAFRASTMEAKGVFSLVSRESALVVNNLLLAVSCFVVFVGTMWPLIAEMFLDRKLSVGPPFFNAAFTPFMVLLGLALPIGSAMPWKRAQIGRSFRPLRYGFVLAIAITGRGPNRLARLMRLPRADWGKATAHAGLGVTMAGIAGLTSWTVDDIRVGQVDEPFDVGKYTLIVRDVSDVRGPNYISTMAQIDLFQDGREIARLTPEKRFYPVAQMPTTEAGIHQNLARDVYVVIGDEQVGGGWAVRTYIKPMTNWIWIGCALMSLGGFISLTDRRFRVGVGAARAKPQAVPAE